MFKVSKSLGFAALLIFASALLHILAALVGGFTIETLRLVPVALIYALIGYFLIPNRRWLAWLAFLVMLAGSIVSIFFATSGGAIPAWWWALILATDLAAALMLFVYLWFPKPVAA